MAAQIGALMVDIGANVARLQHDMNRAQRTFQKSAQRIKGISKALGVSIAASIGIGGMVRAGKASLEMADKYAKASRSIGISVESLSAFNHVAELSGTTFETLVRGSGRLAANMKDMRDGVGEAKDAFEELDVKVASADGKMRSTESVILDIAQRFSEMEDGSRKTALAMDIFGRSGAEMIPMLNNGKQGIQAMQAEAQKLGITFTTEAAYGAELVNDQMLRVQRSFGGLVNNIMVKLLPDLQRMSDLMFESASNTSEMEYVTKALSLVLKNLMTIGVAVQTVLKQIGIIVATVAKSAKQVIDGDFQAALNTMASVVDRTVENVETAWARLKTIWGENVDPLEVTRTSIIQNLSEIETKAKESTQALEAYTIQSAQTTENVVAGAFDNAADSVARFATTGKFSFRDFANSIISDMTRIYVKQQLLGPLMNSISGMFGPSSVSGASNYYGGQINAGATAGELSSFFSNNFNGNVFSRGRIMPHYNGGIVNSLAAFPMANGNIGTMGEKGPEAIMPLTRIGGKLGVRAEGGGGSQQINFTQNLDLRGATETDAKALRAAAKEGADIALAKFRNELKRGGPAYSLSR